MKKRIIIATTAFLFLLTAVLSPPLAQADFLIKSKKHSDALVIMGQQQKPEKDEIGATWLAKDKMRRDEGEERTTVVRYDTKKIYVIDHTKKTYSEMDLPIDMEALVPEQAKQMLQTMEVSASVTDTGETQTIQDWKCTKYLVEISLSMMGMAMPIKMDIWASKDLGIDLKAYEKFNAEILSLNPMFKDLIEEFKKMEGYPVLTKFSMSIMGSEQKFEEQVISADKTDAPAGTYDLPEGYTEAPYNPMEQR